MGLSIDEQKAVDRFRKEVVDPSQTQLVILDFWAEWCGPCKALTPMLEKVAADYAAKGVKLVKLNVDEEPFIAGQFQVQSIPTVYAIFQGQPVADLTPARQESQLRQMIDQLLEKLPITAEAGDGQAAPDVAQFVTMAEEMLTAGDPQRAGAIFMQVLQMEPENLAANAGLIRCMIELGEVEKAQQVFAVLPESVQGDPALAQAKSALELAANAPQSDELDALRAAAEAAPDDPEAQLAYAGAAFAAGQRDDAAASLLAMVEADPAWNEGAARAKLLQIFEAVGMEDPWVSANRRKLSLILFG